MKVQVITSYSESSLTIALQDERQIQANKLPMTAHRYGEHHSPFSSDWDHSL